MARKLLDGAIRCALGRQPLLLSNGSCRARSAGGRVPLNICFWNRHSTRRAPPLHGRVIWRCCMPGMEPLTLYSDSGAVESFSRHRDCGILGVVSLPNALANPPVFWASERKRGLSQRNFAKAQMFPVFLNPLDICRSISIASSTPAENAARSATCRRRSAFSSGDTRSALVRHCRPRSCPIVCRGVRLPRSLPPADIFGLGARMAVLPSPSADLVALERRSA